MRSALDGLAFASAVMLGITGVWKLRATIRHQPAGTAIAYAMRLGSRSWRIVYAVTGVVEVAAAASAGFGTLPRLGGALMTTLGLAFLVSLARVRQTGAPGDCGCIPGSADGASWRAFARAAWVLGAGILLLAPGTWSAQPNGRDLWWLAGAVIGVSALLALSLRYPLQMPPCRRPLCRPTAALLRQLRSHPVFTSIATSSSTSASYGVPLSYEGHVREGCHDIFRFQDRAPDGSGRTAVFRVLVGSQRRLVVHASVRYDAPVQGI